MIATAGRELVLATEQEVVLGDCLERLREIDDDTFDASVTDPPYGLSQEPDIAEVMKHWLVGDVYTHGSNGMMGKSWDSFVPGPEYWREVFRVLKPGAYLFAFSSTRTDDLLSIAIRFAGFERRDEIRCEGESSLALVYGSGFPKSMNVSKALSAATPTTATNSDLAKAFKGRGTALKPAWEPVLVFRKPFAAVTSEDIFAETGWDHWCSRRVIASAKKMKPFVEQGFEPIVGEMPDESGDEDEGGDAVESDGVDDPDEQVDEVSSPLTPQVRPHFVVETRRALHSGVNSAKVLKHADGIAVLEEKPFKKWSSKTATANIIKFGTGSLDIDGCRIVHRNQEDRESATPQGKATSRKASGDGGLGAGVRETDRGGFDRPDTSLGRWPANIVFSHTSCCNEISDSWRCPHWCPVANLDAQSGATGARAPVSGHEASAAVEDGGVLNPRDRVPGVDHNDKGGASRFFYQAKPSRAERELGCEHLPPRKGSEAVSREEGSAGTKLPRAGAGRTTKQVRNYHPTVKSIAIMQWIVRMSCRRGGLILDPFCGSGTTLCAAALEGANAIGIEREPDYVAIAEARVAYWRREASRLAGG